jgi:hypothetical protein
MPLIFCLPGSSTNPLASSHNQFGEPPRGLNVSIYKTYRNSFCNLLFYGPMREPGHLTGSSYINMEPKTYLKDHSLITWIGLTTGPIVEIRFEI